MTKQRSNYLYELVGIIREKKDNKHQTREGFNLLVELTNYPKISVIRAFKDKLSSQQI
jgi:hypothetical protein